MEVAP